MSNENEEIKITQILLTGGGANMDFVQQICKKVFGDASLVFQSDHEVCVAKGLACYGRYCISVIRVKDESTKFLEHGLEKLIKDKLSDDFWTDFLIELVQEGLIKGGLIRDSLNAWREGDITTMDDIDDHLLQNFNYWLIGNQAKSIIRDKIDPLLESIKATISSFSSESDEVHKSAELELILDDILKQLDNLEFDLFNPDQVNALSNIAGIVSASVIFLTSTFLTWAATIEPSNVMAAVGVASWISLELVRRLTNWTMDEQIPTLFKTGNIPKPLRVMFLNEDRMSKIINNIEREIKDRLLSNKNQQKESYTKYNNEMVKLIKTNLSCVIEELENTDKWLIS